MAKLKRYDNFEQLKAEKKVSDAMSSDTKELAIKKAFAELRKFTIIRDGNKENNLKANGG